MRLAVSKKAGVTVPRQQMAMLCLALQQQNSKGRATGQQQRLAPTPSAAP